MRKFSFDGRAVAIILVLTVVFHEPIGDAITLSFGYLSKTMPESIFGTVAWSIIANFLSAGILVLVGLLVFTYKTAYHLAGEYEAYEYVNGTVNQTPTGTATIKIIPFTLDKHGILVALSLNGNGTNLSGTGHIVKDRYLIGHYSEPGNPARRRCGSFTYELSGSGTDWEGDFSFVDPQQGTITTGRALWKKK